MEDEKKSVEIKVYPKETGMWILLTVLVGEVCYKTGKWVGKQIEKKRNRIPGSEDPETIFSGKWYKI